jgi:hypothetical protein
VSENPKTEQEADMAETVADQMVEILFTAGVKRIYGIVGDSLNGFTDALRRHGGIDWLHLRHEEVAAFAAGADAHVTGGLAVCAGSCGPGNLHLINGLFDCHRSRVPVVAIAAHTRRRRSVPATSRRPIRSGSFRNAAAFASSCRVYRRCREHWRSRSGAPLRSVVFRSLSYLVTSH